MTLKSTEPKKPFAEELFALDDTQLQLQLRRTEREFKKLPATLRVSVVVKVGTRALVPYLLERKRQGLSFLELALELNRFYKTDLITRSMVASALHDARYRKKYGVSRGATNGSGKAL